jgi:hypothetical protein
MSVRTTALATGAALAGSLALALPAAAVTGAPTPTQLRCDKAAWEAKVQGNPHVDGGDAAGDYLWHDSYGFHLRVTHVRNSRQVYRGSITSSARLRLDPARLEGRDTVALSADHRTMTFAFYNYGHIDGVNFHTDCATALRVSRLSVDGTALPRTHVYLGAHQAHPADVPFIVHRVVTASS